MTDLLRLDIRLREYLSAIERAWLSSGVVAGATAFVRLLSRWTACSTSKRIIESAIPAIHSGFNTALTVNAVGGLGDSISVWIRHSVLFLLLPDEPDTDVVVVDLNQTTAISVIYDLFESHDSVLAEAYSRSRVIRALRRLVDR